ncbi:MAG: T9SS type A sorting domain-containing protein [Bacteroidales bacterium]|nr:T9SS type A sorting domain-containing protein [Bacteroidales bacterium]
MKKIYILLIIFSSIMLELRAQTILNEGFESGSFSPLVSFQTVGSFNSAPGITDNTNFGSTRAFSFGKSTCGSSCFDNYKTTLIITFPSPAFVDSIMWKEMEIDGNWGSQGQVFLDDVVFGGATLGAMPVNSGVPDATPQLKSFSVNQTVTTIKFVVNDITNASGIILDDLQIKYTLIPRITGYEYWFNNDFSNKTTIPVTSTQQLIINQNISTTGLSSGLNVLNLRSFDNYGKYSSVLSSFFYKTATSQINPNPQILAYEYWIDDDYSNAVVVNTPVQQQINIIELIPMNSLSNGIHKFNIRFKDNEDLWSSVVSNFFYKTPQQVVTQNMITEYRYWFDNDFANAVNLSLTPNQQINLTESLDLTQIPKGTYEIHFQFKDTLGMWSVVLVDTIQKASLPIADFSYIASQTCDSTTVNFADNSIDGDTYLWDFGDGTNSTLTNPGHVYYTPNTYQVSLTVTDTLLGIDSTLVIPIVINSLHTADSIVETVCDSYTAPDGQVHTTSGIKTAIIPNVLGCDSIVTINLTVLASTSSSITETTCGSYTAPDGQVHTTSGIKTAIIPNAVGCDSTIAINLTVLTSTSSSITETVCGSYTAPDGQVYTTSGIKTAIIPNAVGCDSTIAINLTINTVDTSVTQNGITLSANTTGATYQWLDCNNSLSIIPGETNQTFTPTQNGSYAVEVTQNNCVDTSACYVVTMVGILENTFENEIIVFPNPTNGFVKINLNKTFSELTVIITDESGKLTGQSTYKNTAMFEMNLDVPSGIYLLTINAGDKKATIRLIKN